MLYDSLSLLLGFTPVLLKEPVEYLQTISSSVSTAEVGRLGFYM